jgi:hypothetical protein
VETALCEYFEDVFGQTRSGKEYNDFWKQTGTQARRVTPKKFCQKLVAPLRSNVAIKLKKSHYQINSGQQLNTLL